MTIFDDDDEYGDEDFFSAEDIINVIQELKPVFDAIVGAVKNLAQAVRSNSISYDDVMGYCIDHKDDNPEIVKGAILKKAKGDGFVVIQVFLDKNNKIVTNSLGKPLGYKKKVKRMDDELLHLFKGNDLIIVE